MLELTRNLIVGLVLALAAGCATEGGEVLIIRQNQVPEEGCVISGDVGNLFRGNGVIDVNAASLALPSGYFFTPVVENRAVTPMNGDATQRLITVQGAEIKLDGFEFSAPDEFSIRTSGTVEPDGGTIGLGFEVLGVDHLAELSGSVEPGGAPVQVIARVKVFGELAGSGVESEPFEYPINVCDGCLTLDLGECSSLSADFQAELTGGACNPLQDASAECCTDGNGNLICPAVGTAAPM